MDPEEPPLPPWSLLHETAPHSARAELLAAVDIYLSARWAVGRDPEADPEWEIAFTAELLQRLDAGTLPQTTHGVPNVSQTRPWTREEQIADVAQHCRIALEEAGLGHILPEPSGLQLVWETVAGMFTSRRLKHERHEDAAAIHLFRQFLRSREHAASHGPERLSHVTQLLHNPSLADPTPRR